MWRKKKITTGCRTDGDELQNTDGESEKEENSDELKTERGKLQNGGREPAREQRGETKIEIMGNCCHFLSSSQELDCRELQKCAACRTPALGSVLHPDVGDKHHLAEQPQVVKESPAERKKLTLFLFSWFCFKKNPYLTSKYNCQGRRTQAHQAGHL